MAFHPFTMFLDRVLKAIKGVFRKEKRVRFTTLEVPVPRILNIPYDGEYDEKQFLLLFEDLVLDTIGEHVTHSEVLN